MRGGAIMKTIVALLTIVGLLMAQADTLYYYDPGATTLSCPAPYEYYRGVWFETSDFGGGDFMLESLSFRMNGEGTPDPTDHYHFQIWDGTLSDSLYTLSGDMAVPNGLNWITLDLGTPIDVGDSFFVIGFGPDTGVPDPLYGDWHYWVAEWDSGGGHSHNWNNWIYPGPAENYEFCLRANGHWPSALEPTTWASIKSAF
jgi:hypothetical protein